MTGTVPEIRGGFPELKPVDAPPELGRFVAAMRRLQDLTVSTNPDAALWARAAEHVENLCTLLEDHQVPEGLAPAGRDINLPGLGHPLLPPWTITDSGPDGVAMAGHFTRYHVGGNNAVHGGVIPLLYDWLLGMVVSAAGRPISRTAYLHVDYRNVTPIEQPLTACGRIAGIEGRKAFVSATMTTADGTLPSEAHGLMVRLLPHQS
ncbi:PaaI family thioesterase [Mycobacterium celatum]|uniref:Acyl-coenzyme A thioesterase THEM4 n=1 Tax=Mycobacterium celatum TaxID=28045 RepID=A0A1X1RU93_MYCCE|nr:PaaI family thioesterase [Mycobacterium celatum]ORV16665.1 thioesterase [Mycobacterium celatum]PIB79344.1 PaaI family thioesterase [Mycobacterium celatum]